MAMVDSSLSRGRYSPATYKLESPPVNYGVGLP
jgi:hypothetical protein